LQRVLVQHVFFARSHAVRETCCVCLFKKRINQSHDGLPEFCAQALGCLMRDRRCVISILFAPKYCVFKYVIALTTFTIYFS